MTEPLPISALQHYIFCPRQCALIHLEGLWAENRLTVEGHLLHRKAHGEHLGPRGGGRSDTRASHVSHLDRRVRTIRGLWLCSEVHGIVGKADVVEFHSPLGEENAPPDLGPLCAGSPQSAPRPCQGPARGVPYPIEYKRGKPKGHDADLVQLCAQALCLEEMLNLPAGSIRFGAIYYGASKHRTEVEFAPALRDRTFAVIAACRLMLQSGITPRVARERKCARCSMMTLCLPGATAPGVSASRYLDRAMAIR